MKPHDLGSALEQLRDGRLSAAAALERNLAAARGPAAAHAFTALLDASARATASAIDAQVAAGVPRPPLGGLAVSVKALFDVAGQTTTAGSRVLADAPPAGVDCPAVARLRAAGASLIGLTNMSEFAFSGVGINPHHGTPINPITRDIDGITRIPGGSTAGGAVSVAAGAAWAALGSDTGGSIRIPAALQGLVGFKNTAHLTPNDGSVPLSPSLDTTCAITRSVRDAVQLHEILAQRSISGARKPLAACRLAVVEAPFLDGADATVAAAFDRGLRILSAAGVRIETIALPALAELPTLQAGGGFPAAESWAWHRHHLARSEALYDPRVALRIRRGEAISAADYIDLLAARRRWIAAMERSLQGFDAVVSPTVPVVASPLQPLLDSDELFFATNALLLRNPSIVNLLDGCAISLPCQRGGELPVGLMLWQAGGHDDALLALAMQVEAALAASRES